MAIPQAVLDKISTENLDETFSKAGKMGLNPVDLFQKLVAYPGLLARLKDPKVRQSSMHESPEHAIRNTLSTSDWCVCACHAW